MSHPLTGRRFIICRAHSDNFFHGITASDLERAGLGRIVVGETEPDSRHLRWAIVSEEQVNEAVRAVTKRFHHEYFPVEVV